MVVNMTGFILSEDSLHAHMQRKGASQAHLGVLEA